MIASGPRRLAARAPVLLAAAFFAAAATGAEAATGATAILYVFAGQSNMRGHVATLAGDSAGAKLIPSPYREAYTAAVPWAWQWNATALAPDAAHDIANNAFGDRFVPYRAGYSPRTGAAVPWGPEVAFVYQRHLATGEPVYFLKYAIGGTMLAAVPGKRSWNAAASGDLSLLAGLEARIAAARAALLAAGRSRVEIHLLWAQGESDTGANGRSYAGNFIALDQRLAARFTSANTSFRTDTMTLVANVDSRVAQANMTIAASALATQLVNVHDYPAALFIADNLHLGPAGQIRHGEEMELVARTTPRSAAPVAGPPLGSLSVKIPVKPQGIVNVPTVANGGFGLELLGATAGLAIDSWSGKISVVDPAQLAPGVRHLTVRRHSVAGVTDSALQLKFVL